MQTAILQTITGMIGAIGFAVLFGITDKRTHLWIAAGSAAGWVIYLAAVALGDNIYVGLLLASMFINAYSECMARVLKVPAIFLMVPCVIPEIPGGDLYYTMAAMVNKDLPLFRTMTQKVVLEASSIALGIVLVAFVERFVRLIITHTASRRRS